MAAATVTSKWQMVMPQAVREHLRIRVGDKVDFIIEDSGQVVVRPIAGDVRRLKGFLPKPRRAVALEDMEQAIGRGAASTMRRGK